MNYKINSLYNKVYKNFITGVYGNPKIPEKSDIMSKIAEFTSTEYYPITKFNRMDNIDISNISNTFENIIDDLDILFDSVESESRTILNQLTNSLKEYRGSKRELRRVNTRAEDILNGKMGEEYLEYNFSESFDDSENVNLKKSDPLDVEAGEFSITSNKANVLTLQHYYNQKIDFNVIENYSNILEYGYVGNSDAASMLDPDDPRYITYKFKTSSPTRLKVAFSLALTPDARPVEINSVSMIVDSSITKGFVRIMHKIGYRWEDVKGVGIQQIKGDRITFQFDNISTTYLKFEFIKDYPDVTDSNEYLYSIHSIAIYKAQSQRKATLYSKPIAVTDYNNETKIINNIKATGLFEIPDDTSIELYVAQDKTISGKFLDSAGSEVFPESPNIAEFDPTKSGTVYLSDIRSLDDTISGIDEYKGIDYDWKRLGYGKNQANIPRVIEFNNVKDSQIIDNSLFVVDDLYTFGDEDYISGKYLDNWWYDDFSEEQTWYKSTFYDNMDIVDYSGSSCLTSVGDEETFIENVSGAFDFILNGWLGSSTLGIYFSGGYFIAESGRVAATMNPGPSSTSSGYYVTLNSGDYLSLRVLRGYKLVNGTPTSTGVLSSGVHFYYDINSGSWTELNFSGHYNDPYYLALRSTHSYADSMSIQADYSGIVDSGYYGYPFNYTIPSLSRTLKFGNYNSIINGWWRPASFIVTPTGLNTEYLVTSGNELQSPYDTIIPDFHFKGNNFYKIYRFGRTEDIIDSSIRLYSYQERPVSNFNDYYPHNFVWKYKYSNTIKTGTEQKASMNDSYKIDLPTLKDNEEFTSDPIVNIKIHNTNDFLFKDAGDFEYIFDANGIPSQLDLTGLFTNRPNLSTNYLYFDFTYKYLIKNEYESTWTGYAIVYPGTDGRTIRISNDEIIVDIGAAWENTHKKLIKKILIENLDSDYSQELTNSDIYNIDFDKDFEAPKNKNRHYKITLFTASDITSGNSAKIRYSNGEVKTFIPFEGINESTINVSTGIKVVNSLIPMTIVDLGTLIYDTPEGNDRRVALIEDIENTKYLVVREPSKDIIPGYNFSDVSRSYSIDGDFLIKNIGHYIRQGFLNSSGIYYTTGSSGINPGLVYISYTDIDTTWNNGTCLDSFPNEVSGTFYPFHSTYLFPINIEENLNTVNVSDNGFNGVLTSGDYDPRAPQNSSRVGSAEWELWLSGMADDGYFTSDWTKWQSSYQCDSSPDNITPNKGHLFYNTAENLPAFYSISYKTAENSDGSTNRFLYKLELTSDAKTNKIPKVKSIRFIINSEVN